MASENESGVIDVPQQKCRAQDFYTKVMCMSIRHEVPICRRCGFTCTWYGDEAKCNHYECAEEGGAA